MRYLFCLTFLLSVLFHGAAKAERVLTYGSFAPATHLVHRAGLEPFFKRVEAGTGGTLEFELFVGGVMGGPGESLQTVRDFVVDSSVIIDGYLKSELPTAAAISELTLLADDSLVFAAAANEMLLIDCEPCKTELGRYGVKALAYYALDTAHLMCRKPTHSLAAAREAKIAVTGRSAVWAKAMGATPVSITTIEMYEALQRGQADCAIGSTAWLTSYSLKDLVRSVVTTPISTYYTALVYDLHEETWADLSADERSVIVKNLPKLVSDITFTYLAEGDAALADAQANGVIAALADQPMLDHLVAHRGGEYAAVRDKAVEAGVENPEVLLDGFLAKVEKWRRIVAEIDRDPVKYEQALWREVFSKIK